MDDDRIQIMSAGELYQLVNDWYNQLPAEGRGERDAAVKLITGWGVDPVFARLFVLFRVVSAHLEIIVRWITDGHRDD